MHHYNAKQLYLKYKVVDFMRWNKIAFIISGLLIIFTLIIINIFGFNWGLDFTGGTVIEIFLEKPIHVDVLRNNIIKSGFNNPLVQNLGNTHEFIIKIQPVPNLDNMKLSTKILSIIKKTSRQKNVVIIKRIEFIGPSVGSDLAQNGILALFFAFIAILLYIGMRFEWRLACSAVLALIHDIILTCGILGLFHIEINLIIIASLMSVIGYSLNDKIVVFDRIRENFYKICCTSSYDIVNISLSQTLKRTLMTSMITLTIIFILFIFGGELLKDFSLTMLIGTIIGTISSIYISSGLALKMGMKRKYLLTK